MAHFTVSKHLTSENYKGFAVPRNHVRSVRLVFLWLDFGNYYFVKYRSFFLFCDIQNDFQAGSVFLGLDSTLC